MNKEKIIKEKINSKKIDYDKLAKLYFERIERIKSIEKSNRNLIRDNNLLERAIHTFDERCKLELDFKRGTKFANYMLKYQNFAHIVQIADFFTLGQKDFELQFKWNKEIMEIWCKADMKSVIQEYRSYWKHLSIENTWCKMFLDMAYSYNKLYEKYEKLKKRVEKM